MDFPLGHGNLIFTSDMGGDILIQIENSQQRMRAKDVCYFPSLGVDIWSARLLISSGVPIFTQADDAAIVKGSTEICVVEKLYNNLWKLKRVKAFNVRNKH